MDTKNRKHYKYSLLAAVKSGDPGIYNVYGVVKFSKVPTKTRGTDFSQVLSITDESLAKDDKLVVSLFYRSTDRFPPVTVGNVIRFHRLQVDLVHGEMKGRPGAGFAWLFVHDEVDQPAASSSSFLYTQHHKDRVLELLSWSKEQNFLQCGAPPTCLSSLVPGQFCDLVCQVVGTVVEEDGVAFVARVWDGTRCQHPVVCSERELERLDYRLEHNAADLAVDIWIYDNHFHHHQSIQPGQIIKLCNLHAALHKGDQTNTRSTDTLPTLELSLHRGTSYGRGLVCLSSNSPLALDLKHRMDSCVPEESKGGDTPALCVGSQEAQTATSVRGVSVGVVEGQHTLTPSASIGCAASIAEAGCSHWTGSSKRPSLTTPTVTSSTDDISCGKPTYRNMNRKQAAAMPTNSQFRPVQEHRDNERQKEPEEKITGRNGCYSGGEDCCIRFHLDGTADQPSLHSATETCMLKTASIISGHEHISYSPLCEVLRSSVPNKFRVLAHLVDFHPDTLDPVHFMRQLCPVCFLLKPVSLVEGEISAKKQGDLFLPCASTSRLAGLCGGKFADWKTEAQNTTLCPSCFKNGHSVSLELIYMLKLVLRDSSGNFLVANVWRDQAVRFFRDVGPAAAFTDRRVLQELVFTLRSLRTGQDPQKTCPPPLDCCLFSFTAPGGPSFHIFDTMLV